MKYWIESHKNEVWGTVYYLYSNKSKSALAWSTKKRDVKQKLKRLSSSN